MCVKTRNINKKKEIIMKKALLIFILILAFSMLFACENIFPSTDSNSSLEGEVTDIDTLADSIMAAGFTDTRERLLYMLRLLLPTVEASKIITYYNISEDGILTLTYNDGSTFEFGKIIYPEGTKFFVISFETREFVSPILVVGGNSPSLPTLSEEGKEFSGWNYYDSASGEWLSFDANAPVAADLKLKPVWRDISVPPTTEPEKTVLSEGSVEDLDALADAIMAAGFTDTRERLLSLLEGYKIYTPYGEELIPTSYKIFDDGTVTFVYSDGVTRSTGKMIYPIGTVLHIISFVNLSVADSIPPIIVADGEAAKLPTPTRQDQTFKGWNYYEESGRLSTYDESRPVTSDLMLTPIWQSNVPDVKIFPISAIVDGDGNNIVFDQIPGGSCEIKLAAGRSEIITIYLTEKRIFEDSFEIPSDETFSFEEISYTEDSEDYAAVLVIEVKIENPNEYHALNFMYDTGSEMFDYIFNFTTDGVLPDAEFKYASIGGSGQNTTGILTVTPDTKADLFIYFTHEITLVSVKLYRNGSVIATPTLYSAGTYALGYEIWLYLTMPGSEDAELEIVWKRSPDSDENTETYTVKAYSEEPETVVPTFSSLTVNEGGNHTNYDASSSTLTFEEETQVNIQFDLSQNNTAQGYDGISVTLDGKSVTVTNEYTGEFFYHVTVSFTVPAAGEHNIVIKYKSHTVKEFKLVATELEVIPIDPDAVTTANFTGVYNTPYQEDKGVRYNLEANADGMLIYLGFTEKVRIGSITVTSAADASITSATITSIEEMTYINRLPITLSAIPEGNHVLTVTYSSLNAPDSKTSTFQFTALKRCTEHTNGLYGYGDTGMDFPADYTPRVEYNSDSEVLIYLAEGAKITEFEGGITSGLNDDGVQDGMQVYRIVIISDEKHELPDPYLDFTCIYQGVSYHVFQQIQRIE